MYVVLYRLVLCVKSGKTLTKGLDVNSNAGKNISIRPN